MQSMHSADGDKTSIELVIEKEGEESFVATCPQLGGIFVHEESEEKARQYGQEAIEIFIEISRRHNDPLPEGINA